MPIQTGAKGATLFGVQYPPRFYIDWFTPDQEAIAKQGGDAVEVPARGFTKAQEDLLKAAVSGAVNSWSEGAAIVAANRTSALFGDLGVAGEQMRWNGTRWRPAVGNDITLGQLIVPDTNNTNIVRVAHYVKIPAGLAKPGDEVWWVGKEDLTGATDTVNFKLGIGGVAAVTYGTDVGLSTNALNTLNKSATAEWGFRFATNTSVRPVTVSGAGTRFGANNDTPPIVTGLPDISTNDVWVQIAHWLTTAAGVAVANLTASRFVLRMGS